MSYGFHLKGCPRCGGDMYHDVDTYGAYAACLQCGHNVCDFLLAGQQSAAGHEGLLLGTEKQRRPRLKYNR